MGTLRKELVYFALCFPAGTRPSLPRKYLQCPRYKLYRVARPSTTLHWFNINANAPVWPVCAISPLSLQNFLRRRSGRSLCP
jgi:hypothetical protein